MATFITENLARIDGLVGTYAETVFTDFAGPLTTTIRLGGILALALLGANTVLQLAPLRVSDFAKWSVRYIIVLSVATSWAQFQPFYDIVTNVPAEVGARLLDASGTTSLNEAMDDMVTAIFDFSDRAADESGFILSALLSFALTVVGALMACVAIVVAGIGKIGLAMAVSLAPIFIAGLLFKATSDLFSTWCKFTLGFALIPLVLAGVMGVIVNLGAGMIDEVESSGALTDAAGFLIMAMAAIFLMSQVPTMVNGLAGTVVATASGLREASQMAGIATGVGGIAAGGIRAGAQAEPGSRGRESWGEIISAYEARKAAIEGNQKRMANFGRRSTLGGDLEAGQAGLEQHARRRWREMSEAKANPDGTPPGPGPTARTK